MCLGGCAAKLVEQQRPGVEGKEPKRGAVRRRDGLVYGMNCSVGGVLPSTKQPSLPSWDGVARPLIPRYPDYKEKQKGKIRPLVCRPDGKRWSGPAHVPAQMFWLKMVVVVVEGDGGEGNRR